MTRSVGRLVWPLLAGLFAFSPALFFMGRAFDEEIPPALGRNWSEWSFLRKAVDTRGWDFYQGRELSIAIDVLDQQWLRWLMNQDVLWFVAPSLVLASLAYLPIGIWLVPRAFPSIDWRSRWLALAVLLSCFVHQSTGGLLNRATKPLVAPLLLALSLIVAAELREPRLTSRRAAAVVFALGLALALLDRQGLFYLLLLVAGLSGYWVLRRRGLPLLGGAAAAVVVWQLYFHLLGPRLVQHAAGYWPSMKFQRLALGRLLRPEPWIQGLDLLGDWTSVLLAGLPAGLALAAAVVGFLGWAWRQRSRPGRVALVAACALGAMIAQATMVAMMVDRHAPVLWPGSRLWNYPLPYLAFLLFSLLFVLDRLLAWRASLARPAALLLGVVVAVNAARWPELRIAMTEDPPFREQQRRSEEFVRSWWEGAASPSLDGAQRRLFFDCLASFPSLQGRVRPQVGEAGGVHRSELDGGRLVAWAEADAHLVAWTRRPGRYLLVGAVELRAGDRVSILLGGSRPRLLGKVSRPSGEAGVERIRIPLELAAGPTDLELVSSLPEGRLPGLPRGARAAYRLHLPFALLEAPAVR